MGETLVKTEEFKDSLLGKVPKEWEVCSIEEKLERIIDYRGKTPKKTTSGVPLITAKNIREGYLDPEPHEYIHENDYDRWMTRGFPNPEAVLFTTEAPLGNVARVPSYKLALAQRLLTLHANPNELDAGYLFWVLNWSESRHRLEQKSTGSTVLGIKQSVFRKVLFRFPSLPEQRCIAAILNTIDSTIAHTTTLIAKLKQMKAGLLHDLLTRGLDENGELRDATQHPEQFKDSPLGRIPKDWELLKLESLLNGRPKNGYSPKEVNEWTGTLMLGLGCLTEEGFEPLQLKNAPRNNFKIYTALLSDGDFLLSRSNTRERVALAGIYSDVGVPCIYSDLMMRLSINEKTSNLFLDLLLRHSPVRKQLTGNAQGTSGSMVKISSQTVMQTLAALPYLKEQAQIIKCIDTHNTRIRTEEAYLKKLKLQKQGLMHDLLTGKVRVKNA